MVGLRFRIASSLASMAAMRELVLQRKEKRQSGRVRWVQGFNVSVSGCLPVLAIEILA